MKLLPKIFPRSQPDHRIKTERKLLQYEARVGGQLFGPVPEGHERQFFCLDEHTWFWHESWLDQNGKRQSITTRYDVRPNGVLKLQNGMVYQRLSRDEARNLYRAIQLYVQRITAEYQRLLQAG
jgi:hypothetical protein